MFRTVFHSSLGTVPCRYKPVLNDDKGLIAQKSLDQVKIVRCNSKQRIEESIILFPSYLKIDSQLIMKCCSKNITTTPYTT